MVWVEVVLLIIGIVAFIASFTVPITKEQMSEEERGLSDEEIRNQVAVHVEKATADIRASADETVQYAVEKTERSLERVSNEKIMEMNEYADTVLSDIHKNHEEVVFLYDMLNDKQVTLKNVVTEVEKTAKAVSRIADEAKQAADEGKQTADEAKQTAGEAAQTAEETRQAAEEARQASDEAMQAAEEAAQAADGARQTADEAAQAAEKARQTAGEAMQTASQAVLTADEGRLAASEAKQTADETMQSVSRTAQEAMQTAGEAIKSVKEIQAAKEESVRNEKAADDAEAPKDGFRPLTAERILPAADGTASEKVPKKTVQKAKPSSTAKRQTAKKSVGTGNAKAPAGNTDGGQSSAAAAAPQPADGEERNNNEAILALHKAGKSNIAIAKELGLGVGEIKLVIDLFNL